jgi:uridine phosphorylase
MPDTEPVPRSGSQPLKINDEITARHLNGREQTVLFETIGGDKLDQVRVRWPLAGFYDVDIESGQLLGGGRKKGRKAPSVWTIIPSDMDRVRVTQEKLRTERRERMRKNKGSRE